MYMAGLQKKSKNYEYTALLLYTMYLKLLSVIVIANRSVKWWLHQRKEILKWPKSNNFHKNMYSMTIKCCLHVDLQYISWTKVWYNSRSIGLTFNWSNSNLIPWILFFSTGLSIYSMQSIFNLIQNLLRISSLTVLMPVLVHHSCCTRLAQKSNTLHLSQISNFLSSVMLSQLSWLVNLLDHSFNPWVRNF